MTMLATAADTHLALLVNGGIALSAFLLFRMLRPDRAFDRAFLCMVGVTLLLNYIHWRLTDALPPLIPGPAILFQGTFLVFEMMVLVNGIASLVIMIAIADRSREADAAADRFSGRPGVDIFICTYNEPIEILERSILCAARVAYPNCTVWVCDDTRRDWLKDWCREAGVEYITRQNNKGAKAGNLNNALRVTARQTNAPFVMVLDADFCVRPNIIDRMLPLFEDEMIGLVQTPQFFYNPDPIQHNLFSERHLCDDQRSFFDIMEPSKDVANAAFCVGTSFIVRRAAVEKIDGFPDGAICEDLNLSYRLYQIGFITRWLNEKLSIGISAESIPEYLTQRTRWCLGTIQVGLLPGGPLLGRGYSITLRMHYILNLLSWLSKPFILLVLIAPAVFFWTGVPVFETELVPFLAAALPCFLFLWGHGIWISEGRGLPIFTEVGQSVTAIPLARVILVAFTRPFGKPFKVTAKGVARTNVRVHWPLVRVFAAIVVVTLAGMASDLVSPDAPITWDDLDRLNVVWAGLAILVSLLSIVALVDRPRPDEEMFALDEAATVYSERDRSGGPARLVSASTRKVVLAAPWGNLGVAALNRESVSVEIAAVGRVPARVAGRSADGIILELSPSERQRRELIVKLYSQPRTLVAETGSLGRTMAAVFRNAA